MATKASLCTYVIVCTVTAYLGLSNELMMILTILLAVDYATGIAKSYYIKREITSQKMTDGLIRKAVVMLVPFIFALAVKSAGQDAHTVLSFMLSALCLSECYSILGNIASIRSKKEYAEFDGVNLVINGFMSMIDKAIRKYISDKELTDHGVEHKKKK